MGQTHTIRVVRGLNSTEVTCEQCAYAYLELVQDRTMTRLARRKWIDQGDPDVIHIGTATKHPTSRTA